MGWKTKGFPGVGSYPSGAGGGVPRDGTNNIPLEPLRNLTIRDSDKLINQGWGEPHDNTLSNPVWPW